MTHREPPKRTGAKAERKEDQETVDRFFGTEDACTTGWEGPEPEGSK